MDNEELLDLEQKEKVFKKLLCDVILGGLASVLQTKEDENGAQGVDDYLKNKKDTDRNKASENHLDHQQKMMNQTRMMHIHTIKSLETKLYYALEALQETYLYILDCEPNFTKDEGWPDTESKIKKALEIEDSRELEPNYNSYSEGYSQGYDKALDQLLARLKDDHTNFWTSDSKYSSGARQGLDFIEAHINYLKRKDK